MIVIPDLKTLSLDALQADFVKHTSAARHQTGCRKSLYNFVLDLYCKEFERRADLIPTALLLDLISSGLTFSFNPNAKK